jgi:predicted dehydrogenase
MCKLRALVQAGFFGRVTGFRLEFGWWVFDGFDAGQPCQRPSWNYRTPGGGLMLDMYVHFRYLIEGMLVPVRRLVTLAATAMPERVDEADGRYAVDVEDQAATLVELTSGATGVIIASWATRLRGDDLITFHIDGTKGSASAGPHRGSRPPIRWWISPSITARPGTKRPRPARIAIPTGSAGRISCAISRRTHRSAAISPPASATSRSPRPAGAARANGRGSILDESDMCNFAME